MALKNNKQLGQHWLKNPEYLAEIADLAVKTDNIRGSAANNDLDTRLCLEIGSGLGTLTSRLLKRFAEVVAIEFDQRLAQNLPKSFPGKNLTIINTDVLQYPEEQSAREFLTFSENREEKKKVKSLTELDKYVVVGNIPYYITSPIIRKFLLSPNPPEKMVLLIQKEVAERIAAEPGKHSLLSLFVQNYAEVELGSVVPAVEFTPPPKVDSQIIAIKPIKEPIISDSALKLAKLGFSNPRKKIASNLAQLGHDREYWRKSLESIGANPDCRAQDLELVDWQDLVDFDIKH